MLLFLTWLLSLLISNIVFSATWVLLFYNLNIWGSQFHQWIGFTKLLSKQICQFNAPDFKSSWSNVLNRTFNYRCNIWLIPKRYNREDTISPVMRQWYVPQGLSCTSPNGNGYSGWNLKKHIQQRKNANEIQMFINILGYYSQDAHLHSPSKSEQSLARIQLLISRVSTLTPWIIKGYSFPWILHCSWLHTMVKDNFPTAAIFFKSSCQTKYNLFCSLW